MKRREQKQARFDFEVDCQNETTTHCVPSFFLKKNIFFLLCIFDAGQFLTND